jgi:hypothetical protein
MRINTSQISMDASVEHKDVTGKSTQLTATTQEEQPEFQLRLPGMSGISRERIEENRQSQKLTATSVVKGSAGEKKYETTANQVVERMAREVMGHRVRLHRIPGLRDGGSIMLSEPVSPPGQQTIFSLTSHTTSYHYERISVHSSGSVQLADGRDISFSLDLSMERESMVRESVAWRAAGGVLMDPLVFSFDCDLRSLTSKSFHFDLDSDGQEDESFSLQPGSGFLALDLNNDGLINNGAELFGPTTGHGFQELAKHDLDANGWIDENDPIFSKLRIWKPGTTEGAELIGLAEAGIGAISLTHNQTSFQLRDSNNKLLGEVAASGFFLTEEGEVRPLQEIKLAIKGNASENTETVVEKETMEPQFFLRRIAAIRQVEVQQMARFSLVRRNQSEERDLLASLFPENLKERGLASVEARNGNDALV